MLRSCAPWLCLLLLASSAVGADPEPKWRSLFNGKDLDGWDTYLGPPHPSTTGLDLKRDEQGKYLEPVGLNKDPTDVFTIVQEDGQPAIRISGQIYGAITSQEEFENYHLRLETKWGEKRWPPREETVRDSGLLYHCIGEHGTNHRYWLKSFECQIQEGDNGDFFSVAGVLVDVEGEVDAATGRMTYRKGAPLNSGWKSRIVRNPRSERPSGEWNTVEIYVHGQTAVHISEGKTNMVLTGLRHVVDGQEVPLTKGKIQIQSESAEVFYRNIQIRPIDRIPDEVL